METEPLRADRDDRGRGASDAGRLHGGEGKQHLRRRLLFDDCDRGAHHVPRKHLAAGRGFNARC